MAQQHPQPNWMQRRIDNFGDEYANWAGIGAGVAGGILTAITCDDYVANGFTDAARGLTYLGVGTGSGIGIGGAVRVGLNAIRTGYRDMTAYERNLRR